MKVHCQLRHRNMARDSPKQRACLLRCADADRVAERDLIAAEIPEDFCDIDHCLRLDLAVIGAAENAGDIATHFDAVGSRARNHRLEAFDGFGDRAIDVGARKTFRGRAEHGNHLGAGGTRCLVALLVRDQHVKFATCVVADASQHLVGAYHLRNGFR